MIIRPNGNARVAITQPDHAALAARIMSAWQGLRDSPRRDDIVLAIAEHDNGWREVDDQLRVDPATGAVLDFMTIADDVKRGVWYRAIDRLSATPYAAALVAYHAAYVYGRYRPNAAWAQFFVDMDAAGAGTAMADYLYVRIGDLISLVFCTQTIMQAPEFGYALELNDGNVIVTPDPFAGKEVAISIDGRELQGAAFGQRVTITGIVKGAP
jgi:hypothetical protein